MLKNAMAGEDVKNRRKKWNPQVKAANVELISNVTGKPVELVKNEQSADEQEEKREI